LAERFWSKVAKGKPEECWPWLASRRPNGYGQIGLGGHAIGYAHRVAWELSNGPIPAGTVICHKCDNPPCCNPSHLVCASQSFNRKDAYSKGRVPPGFHMNKARGSGHGQAKLTESQVVAIREAYASGRLLQRQIAGQFGVSPGAISDIVNKKTWSHV